MVETNKQLVQAGMKTRFKPGNKPHNYIGRTIKKGKNTNYVLIHYPDHPHKNKDGNVFEHRLIMEKHLGRILEKDEEIHHKDRNGMNNDLSNLVVLTQAEHKREHLKETLHKRWS